jgi:hypothetical protein
VMPGRAATRIARKTGERVVHRMQCIIPEHSGCA